MLASIGTMSSYRRDISDSDAHKFIMITGITDQYIMDAVDDLVTSAKSNGWWDLCIAIYPLVGGTATTCKYNLKDLQDTDAAFRLNFVNSPTITATGVDWNGTTQYADTFIIPSTHLTAQNTHLSYYSRENVSSTGLDMGTYNGGGEELLLNSRHSVSGFMSDQYNDVGSQGRLLFANSDSRGWFLGSRTSSTSHNTYINGSNVASSATSGGTFPTTNIFLAAVPDGLGGAFLHGVRQCAFATIGAGISPSLATIMYGDIQIFQKSLGRSIFDSDAQAFIDATGITDDIQKRSIEDLVVKAKAHGWWTLCDAIYPFVGGTATTHKYNLKDPQDTDGAFRLTFTGTWTHSSTGADPDGSTAYADTHLNTSTVLTQEDTHISYYSREDTSSTGVDMGINDSNNSHTFILLCSYNGTSFITDQYIVSTARINTANSDSRGFHLSSRISTTDFQAYKNSTSLATLSTSGGNTPPFNMYIGAWNNTGTAGEFGNRECAFATIGAGISSTIAAAMYTDIQDFQTALGRQV